MKVFANIIMTIGVFSLLLVIPGLFIAGIGGTAFEGAENGTFKVWFGVFLYAGIPLIIGIVSIYSGILLLKKRSHND